VTYKDSAASSRCYSLGGTAPRPWPDAALNAYFTASSAQFKGGSVATQLRAPDSWCLAKCQRSAGWRHDAMCAGGRDALLAFLFTA